MWTLVPSTGSSYSVGIRNSRFIAGILRLQTQLAPCTSAVKPTPRYTSAVGSIRCAHRLKPISIFPHQRDETTIVRGTSDPDRLCPQNVTPAGFGDTVPERVAAGDRLFDFFLNCFSLSKLPVTCPVNFFARTRLAASPPSQFGMRIALSTCYRERRILETL